MRTLARVDLPDPFGPMMAWISPGRTLRLTPRRISLPSTVAWRSSTSRIGSAISHHSFVTENMSGNRYRPSHVDVVALDLHLVGGHWLGGRAPASRTQSSFAGGPNGFMGSAPQLPRDGVVEHAANRLDPHAVDDVLEESLDDEALGVVTGDAPGLEIEELLVVHLADG